MKEKPGNKSPRPTTSKTFPITVHLEKDQHDIAKKLGHSSKVAGVRIALDEAAEKRGWK